MTLPRILILGILALVVIWVIASAIAMLVPYAAAGLVVYLVFQWLQKTLAAKDVRDLTRQKPPARKS